MLINNINRNIYFLNEENGQRYTCKFLSLILFHGADRPVPPGRCVWLDSSHISDTGDSGRDWGNMAAALPCRWPHSCRHGDHLHHQEIRWFICLFYFFMLFYSHISDVNTQMGNLFISWPFLLMKISVLFLFYQKHKNQKSLTNWWHCGRLTIWYWWRGTFFSL